MNPRHATLVSYRDQDEVCDCVCVCVCVSVCDCMYVCVCVCVCDDDCVRACVHVCVTACCRWNHHNAQGRTRLMISCRQHNLLISSQWSHSKSWRTSTISQQLKYSWLRKTLHLPHNYAVRMISKFMCYCLIFSSSSCSSFSSSSSSSSQTIMLALVKFSHCWCNMVCMIKHSCCPENSASVLYQCLSLWLLGMHGYYARLFHWLIVHVKSPYCVRMRW